MSDLSNLATTVDDAARTANAIPQLSLANDLTVDQAYEVQRLSIQRRLERGEKLVGIKMGLTSRAKMRQVGVHEVIWGHLTNAMRIEDGGRLDMSRYVHPRAEPEIAFLLKAPIDGPLSAAEAMTKVEAVAPAIEVIDSRYENFKFALPDVIADNSSSSGFVIGPWAAPTADIANLGIVLEQNGRPVQYGSTAAILGHPERSLAAATTLASRYGLRLEAGWVILAGGATAAVHLSSGDTIRSVVEGIGRVGFSVS